MVTCATETGAERVVRQCAAWGISHAFCVPGADVTVLIETLEAQTHLRALFATHEFSAGAMADGFSRRSGRPGLAVAIGGPGASYLAAAAAAAARDGSSVLFVTGAPPGSAGQPATAVGWPNDRASFSAAGAICVDISGAGGVGAALEEVECALGSGRCAHLRLPVGDQIAPADTPAAVRRVLPIQGRSGLAPATAHLCGRVALAVGAGALAHATAIRALSASRRLPIVTDMLARGVIPEGAPLALGHLGFMPHPRALAATTRSHALAADRVLALAAEGGFELALRARGVPVQPVPRHALAEWLRAASAIEIGSCEERTRWTDQLARLSRGKTACASDAPLGHDVLVADVAVAVGPSAIHVIDAGHFHLIAPGRLVAREPRTILTASELVSMGWAIGAAIGAKCAAPDSPVVAYVGDGSFMMHGLELTTAARYEIPVLFIVAANGVYGSVRRRMGRKPDGAAVLGPASPVRIAEACGVEAREVRDRAALREALEGAADLRRPRVIVARVPELDDAAQGLPTGLAWLDGTV